MANTTERDAGAAVMTKVKRRVEEFLNEVAETDPNKLDAERLEAAAMEIVKELGLG